MRRLKAGKLNTDGLVTIREQSHHINKIGQYREEEVAISRSKLILLVLFMATMGVALASETLEGEASYYADSLDGNKTASGEIYRKDELTAAHRTLPFGTKVKVTYLENGKSVEVVINDRGPHAKGRLIDLSGAAAKKIGLVDAGHGMVKLEILD